MSNENKTRWQKTKERDATEPGYLEHRRAQIKKRHRKRWDSDPEYRERLRSYSRRWKAKSRRENPEVRKRMSETCLRYYHRRKARDPGYLEHLSRLTTCRKAGITVADYDQIFKAQNGKCAICGDGRSKRLALAIDHDHETGEIRGLLCRHCNVGLGHFKDESSRLWKAFQYLVLHQHRRHKEAS